MNHRLSGATVALTIGFLSLSAARTDAHVTIASGAASANVTQEVAFGVGHGCSGADTYKVTIDIPPGVSSVRGMSSDFGPLTYTKDGGGRVTSVTWQKPDASVYPTDSQYYKLTIRLKPPNAPFTKLVFPTHQTCKAAGGALTTVDWTLPPDSDAGGEPAPVLHVVPARSPGWNRFTVPVALSSADLSAFFKDASIVWRGTAAFSANATTLEQIKAEPGVTLLGDVNAGDVLWVRY